MYCDSQYMYKLYDRRHETTSLPLLLAKTCQWWRGYVDWQTHKASILVVAAAVCGIASELPSTQGACCAGSSSFARLLPQRKVWPIHTRAHTRLEFFLVGRRRHHALSPISHGHRDRDAFLALEALLRKERVHRRDIGYHIAHPSLGVQLP